MKNIKKEEIKALFEDFEFYTTTNGLFFSGYYGDGEYKLFHRGGKLHVHCFYYKNYIVGEYKRYNIGGEIIEHKFNINILDIEGIKLTSKNIEKMKKKHPEGPWLKD